MGKMKKFKQLIKELPSKKVVFAFGRFQPPTTGHELLVNAVKKLAGSTADHVIYASKTEDKKSNPLHVARKVYFLKRMFPKTNFVAASAEVRTPIEAAKELNKKYKNIVLVAGSDRVASFQKLLNDYNGKEYHFDTIEVVSAGERDPDSDSASGMSGTKMREAAKKGDLEMFKRGLPHTLTTVDAKRLMNEIRAGMGLDVIKESIKFEANELREMYRNNQIFKLGELVEDANGVYEIVDRGTNYLTVVDQEGTMQKKWLTEVSATYVKMQEDFQNFEGSDEISYKGYTTKYLHHDQYAGQAFNDLIHKGGDPVAILNALKATDDYMGHEIAAHATQQLDANGFEQFMTHVNRAKEALKNLGDLEHHDYIQDHVTQMEETKAKYTNPEQGPGDMQEALTNKTLRDSDELKVARVIATMLGVEKAETMSNPEQLVNLGLTKVRSKALNPESLAIVKRMLDLAREVNIKYDANLLTGKLKEDVVDKTKDNNMSKGILRSGDYAKLMASQDQTTNRRTMRTGHTDDSDHLRKMKIKHQLGEAEICPVCKEEPCCCEGGEHVKEDMDASDYVVKVKVGSDGKTHKRKVHPKRITFANEEVEKEDPETEEPGENEDIEDSMETAQNAIPFPEAGVQGDADFEAANISDDEIEKMVAGLSDEDIIDHVYQDNEVTVLDDETGEEVEDEDNPLKESMMNEVLSRSERIRASSRFKRTASKRERRLKIALHKTSDSKTVNTRARRMAIKLMKQRFARKPLSQLSVSEKERLEQRVQRMKPVMNRIAMKMVPRIRRLERDRLKPKATGK
jgi:nicotinic acid mononucleotide adenylyltransferase